MLEFVVGALAGVVASEAGHRGGAPPPQSDGRLVEATREVARATRKGASKIADSVQGLGNRETVCWVETLYVRFDGRILDRRDLHRLRERIIEDNPMLRALGPERGSELAEEKVRQMVQQFDIHHFWSIVVGHESLRTSYRTLPDGMARFVHRDPSRWTSEPPDDEV